MPDVFLPAINPVDVSFDNDNSSADGSMPPNPPIGGLLGDGDLTSDDGDLTGWEAYNSSTANTGDPGVDEFEYSIDTTDLPTGVTLTSYRFEITARLVVDSPQGFARPGVSSSWSANHFFDKFWVEGDNLYEYATYSSILRTPTTTMLTQLGDGSARLTYGANRRLSTEELGAVRATMAGIRVYWGSPAPAMQSPRRLWPRHDGLTGGAPRLSGSQSRQTSNRLLGGYI